MKKNDIVQDIFRMLSKTIFDLLKKREIELDEIAESYSKKLDDCIYEEQSKGLKYIVGKFKILYENEKFFNLSYALYFQDENNTNDEYIEISGKSNPKTQKTEYLSKNALEELRSKKVIEYKIDDPTKE